MCISGNYFKAKQLTSDLLLWTPRQSANQFGRLVTTYIDHLYYDIVSHHNDLPTLLQYCDGWRGSLMKVKANSTEKCKPKLLGCYISYDNSLKQKWPMTQPHDLISYASKPKRNKKFTTLIFSVQKILLRKSALEIIAVTWPRTTERNTQEWNMQLFNRFESANILRSISRVIQISSTPED